MSDLLSVDPAYGARILDELRGMGLVTDEELAHRSSMTLFRHGTVEPRRKPHRHDLIDYGLPGERVLTITASVERYDLERAFKDFFAIRDWARVVVGVYGALWARLEDQKRIGRERRPGERSPAPLPDWYELNHLVYEHGLEIGLDPGRPVYQYLPGRFEPYLNIAEALHLRQPR